MTGVQPPASVLRHLESWIGGLPSAPVRLVPMPEPPPPGWDGTPLGIAGVGDPAGRGVLRVPVAVADRLGQQPDVASLLAALPLVMDTPGRAGAGVLRWAVDVPGVEVLPETGVWLPAALGEDADDPRVAPWLSVFGGEVLVALDDDGSYLAGVGIKRHDDTGHELSVVTDERARGRGLGRRPVAQAARRVLAEGRACTYLHAPDNQASAAVARACGFPDTGWNVLGWWPGQARP